MTLSFESVSFRYRRTQPLVLEGLDWRLPEGRTVLLGPNGAGKSTLLALGADVLRPRGGAVRLDALLTGRRRDRTAFRRAVGWMPQHVYAIPGLTCREQVAYAGWLKGLSKGVAWERAGETLEVVSLSERANDRVSQVSGGQLRRVGLAQALVHGARVLLLDEPTVGLDPAQRSRFREVLRRLPNVSVLISTHQVDDLSDLFATVAVMDAGRIVWHGPTADFLALGPASAERPGEAAYESLLGDR